jgi:hypothetical protein
LVLNVPGGGERLFLLAVSVDGALSLSSLEAHQRSKIRARPLPWHPDVVATANNKYDVPGVVSIAGRQWYHHVAEDGTKESPPFSLPHIELFDSSTGQSLNGFGTDIVLCINETITRLALLPGDFWEGVRRDILKTDPDLEDELATNADGKYRCFILASSTLDTRVNYKKEDAKGRLLFFACPFNQG